MNMNMPFPQFQQQQSRYSPPIFMQPQGNRQILNYREEEIPLFFIPKR